MNMMRQFLVVVCSLLVAHDATAWSCDDTNATTEMRLQSLSAYSEAVCNDGTAAAYYYKKGFSNLYLIYLSGGGQCWDLDSCTKRYNGSAYPYHDCTSSSSDSPCFMSSKDYKDTCNKTGIFSEDTAQNPLAKATKIYVPYCTSDAYLGDSSFESWEFRGASVVDAVLNDVVSTLGLGSIASTRLVFGGGSAGGRGAMLWLDRVREKFSSNSNVSVLGFLDSPYYLDIEPYDTDDFVGFPNLTLLADQNFKTSTAVLAGSGKCSDVFFQAPWKCALGQYAASHIGSSLNTTTPFMLVASQFDGWQLSNAVLGYNGIASDPSFNADQLIYVVNFGKATKASLSATVPGRLIDSTKVSIFSPACYSHHVSEKYNFWADTTLDGASQSSTLEALLTDSIASIHIDDCDGYECGAC